MIKNLYNLYQYFSSRENRQKFILIKFISSNNFH